jgi:hypothetical protein
MITRRFLRQAPVAPLLCLSLGILFMLSAAAAPALAAPERGGEEKLSDWLSAKAEHFAAHPEAMTQPGSGWKPYNRIKWFYEQRMVNGEEPEVGARWKVWESKMQIERELTLPARASWFCVGPANYAGRILDLEFDPTNPSILYAGSASGGLWKSTDAGVSWMPLTDELPTLAVGGIAVLPSDPNIVLIGTGEGTMNVDRVGGVGVLKSTDGGLTWSTTGLSYAVSSGHGFHCLEVNPTTGTILAGCRDGLWRSTDDGETWVDVKSDDDYYDVKWKPGDPNVVYCAKGSGASGNNVKVSTDDGVTWTKAGTGQPLSYLVGKTKIAVTPDDPEYIYAIYANRSTDALLGVFRSTDGGVTWTEQATSPNIPGGQGWYNLSIAADPDNRDLVIAGGVGLYRSTNGGVGFSQIGLNVHVDHHAIAYKPGTTNMVFVGSDGGVWESTSDGGSWVDRNSGLVTYQFYDICVNNYLANPNFIMGGTQDQGTDKWTGSTSWTSSLGADGMVCNINPSNGTTVYAETQFGNHQKSTSSGNPGSWHSINNGITGTGLWVTPVDEDQTTGNGNRLFTSTGNGIFRTTDGGSNWTNVDSQPATWISISPVDNNIVWAVAGTPRYTTNGGTTWSTSTPFPFATGGARKILAHPTEANTAFVTFSGYNANIAHIAHTTDLGATWQDVTGDFPSQPVNAIAVDPLDPSTWFIGTDVGVWASTNGGAHWFPYEVGFPNAVVVDLEVQHTTRKLFAGTHGRGAWEVDITPPINTGAGVQVAARPLNLMFDPPYPNPVRGETTLRFAAKSSGPVTVSVYDVRGRLVQQVVREPRGDGIVRWAKWYSDDVPAGVYFAVLRADGEQISHKLIVTE